MAAAGASDEERDQQRLERVRCRDYAALHVHVDRLDDVVADESAQLLAERDAARHACRRTLAGQLLSLEDYPWLDQP